MSLLALKIEQLNIYDGAPELGPSAKILSPKVWLGFSVKSYFHTVSAWNSSHKQDLGQQFLFSFSLHWHTKSESQKEYLIKVKKSKIF